MSKSNNAIHAIGLMSGTSADGVDGVILKIQDEQKPEIIGTHYLPYSEEQKIAIRQLVEKKVTDRTQSEDTDINLAYCYSEVVENLRAQNPDVEISVVGCHGQTINHSPDANPPFSIQIGNGPKLARLSNLPVVNDFRSADLAAGGQGAPLAPGFHAAQFTDNRLHRCIVNIGGIANLTILPACGSGEPTGFDSGPGNTLLDLWCRKYFDCDYDSDGDIARSGVIQLDLLSLFLSDPYFAKPPPKSTGLEYFNQKWLNEKLAFWDGREHASNADILTTLTSLSASTICNDLKNSSVTVDEIYLCGGGSQNSLLVSMLNEKSGIKAMTTGVLGIEPEWVEAAAFAWMAHRTLNGQESTLPSVTGASHPVIAGVVHYPG